MVDMNAMTETDAIEYIRQGLTWDDPDARAAEAALAEAVWRIERSRWRQGVEGLLEAAGLFPARSESLLPGEYGWHMNGGTTGEEWLMLIVAPANREQRGRVAVLLREAVLDGYCCDDDDAAGVAWGDETFSRWGTVSLRDAPHDS